MIDALRGVMHAVRRNGSCAGAHAASDAEDNDVVWYWERWSSSAAFERHLQSERFTQLLSIIETATEAPLLECRLIAETRGLEYIAATREKGRRSAAEAPEIG